MNHRILVLFLGFGVAALTVLSLWLIVRLHDAEHQMKVLRQSMEAPRIEVVAWALSPAETADGERIPVAKRTPIFAVKVGRSDFEDKAVVFTRKDAVASVWERFHPGLPEYRSGEPPRVSETVYRWHLPSPFNMMLIEELALITSITTHEGNLIVELKSDITSAELYWFSGNLGCLLKTKKYC